MKTLASLILILFSYNLYGQKHGDIISQSVLECQYKCFQANGFENVFMLRCGKTATLFYGIDKMRSDSLIANGGGELILNEMVGRLEKRKASSDKRSNAIAMEILYRNLHEGKLSIFNNSHDQYITYDEDIPVIDWEIYEDSTKAILGYDCRLAKAKFRGRQWKAWFTEDIPLGVGPWKLGDLPGLILEASADEYMAFTAITISPNANSPIMFYNYLNKKYKSIDRDKYLEMKKKPLIVPYANVRIEPFPYIELE